MLDAVERVKAAAQAVREGMDRADRMMAAQRRNADAERAEREVAKRLPMLSNEDLWVECGLD